MLEAIDIELSEANTGESIDLWEKRFYELEQVRQQLQIQLEQNQIQLQQTQAKLAISQSELQASQKMISAMKTSKFWKLRTNWLKIKKSLGLPANE